MCLERKRNKRKMVQRLNGDEATENKQGSDQTHPRARAHTHTIPPHPGTKDSPSSKGSREQWGQGK